MSEPELAVVVLSVGAPNELRTAVESLRRQPGPLEIVVVNSGGGDVSAVLPDTSSIKVIELEPLLWPGAARNVGIRATSAPWVAFLASDLVAAPDWAAQRLALHREGRKSVSSAIHNDQRGNLFAWASHAALHAARMRGLPKRKALRYGASYARDLFERYGLFREDLRIGEDTEFHRRLRRRDRPVWAPQVTASHRYPESWRALIADQRARGERSAMHWPKPRQNGWLQQGLEHFGRNFALSMRGTRGRDRAMVLAATPLLLAASLAYAESAARATRELAAQQHPPSYRVAVAILDRDDWGANTDVIVIADPVMRQLIWVPRDLWVPSLHDRVNAAFAVGGGDRLMAALAELNLDVEGVLCLRRSATEAALADVEVTVPVREPLDFWYPLAPTLPIEEGRKQVSFRPPAELLSGERIHQWAGARLPVTGAGSDLYRIERQHLLVAALLASRFDFSRCLHNPEAYRTAGRDPLAILRRVRADWNCCVFDSVSDATIDGKAVLVRSQASRQRTA